VNCERIRVLAERFILISHKEHRAAVNRSQFTAGRHSRERGNPVSVFGYIAAFLDPRVRGDDGTEKYLEANKMRHVRPKNLF
jgi:hypothetical protein